MQSITITGVPTGGSFTLTFGGNTTGTIAYNALASVVQTALQALASIGANNALVTGSAGGPYQVQFTATLGQANQAQMTRNAAGLTGGSSPDVVIATVQNGAAFATISSGFVLQLVGAKVVYTVAQPVGTYVRLHSGSYLPYLAIAGANTVEFSAPGIPRRHHGLRGQWLAGLHPHHYQWDAEMPYVVAQQRDYQEPARS